MSKDVFFFGAGFSKSLAENYPTLTELSNAIKNAFSEEENAIKYYYEKEIPTLLHSNIENLLTYLSSNLPYKNPEEKSKDNALYENIKTKISNYFFELEKDSTIDTSSFSLVHFAKHIIDQKCTCISLNYDLMLENILFKNSPKAYQESNNYSVFYKFPITCLNNRIPDGYGRWASGETDFKKNKMPEIIKLHGSINWLYSEDNNSNALYMEKGGEEQYLKSDLSYFIIPPTLDKQSQYRNAILCSLWTKAFESIQNADRIFIYGFSFPKTDYSVKFLFQSALKNNKTCKIFVINKEEAINELETTYKEVFPDSTCDYSCCVKEEQINELIKML